jgi:hypothetical protein
MIRKIKNYNSQEMCHSLNINHIMNWMIKQQVLQNEHSLLFLNVFVFPQEKIKYMMDKWRRSMLMRRAQLGKKSLGGEIKNESSEEAA